MSYQGDVEIVQRGGHRAAAAVIAAGHAEYPSFRHLFPDAARRARALRAFFEATVRDAIPFGAVLTTGEEGRVDATAVWLPPGASPWSAWRKLRATPSFMRVFLADPHAFPAFARYGGILEQHLRGSGSSWYLEVLSVRPESQRRGLGTRPPRADPRACRPRSRPVPPGNLRPRQRRLLPAFRIRRRGSPARGSPRRSHAHHDAATGSARSYRQGALSHVERQPPRPCSCRLPTSCPSFDPKQSAPTVSSTLRTSARSASSSACSRSGSGCSERRDPTSRARAPLRDLGEARPLRPHTEALA